MKCSTVSYLFTSISCPTNSCVWIKFGMKHSFINGVFFHATHPIEESCTWYCLLWRSVAQWHVGIMNSSQIKLCVKWHNRSHNFWLYIYCFVIYRINRLSHLVNIQSLFVEFNILLPLQTRWNLEQLQKNIFTARLK